MRSLTRAENCVQNSGDGSGTSAPADDGPMPAIVSRSMASSSRQRSHDDRCGSEASLRVPSTMSMNSSGVTCTLESFAAQQLPQVSERVKNIRLDGADRAAERVRDLLMRHLVIRAQDQRGTLLPGQLRDRRPNTRLALGSEQPIGSAVAGAIDELPIGDRLGRQRLRAD